MGGILGRGPGIIGGPGREIGGAMGELGKRVSILECGGWFLSRVVSEIGSS